MRLLVVVFLFFRKAIRSEALADDFVMLLVSYLALQIIFGIWARLGVSFGSAQPKMIGALLIAAIAILAWVSGAKEDSKIFWRGAFEIYLVALFFFADLAIGFAAGLLDALAIFGAALQSSAGLLAWSGVGMAMALYFLYGVGSKSRKSTGQVIEDLRKKINEDLDKAEK